MYVVIAHYLDTGDSKVLGIARTLEEVYALADDRPASEVATRPWTRIEYHGPFEPGDLKAL